MALCEMCGEWIGHKPTEPEPSIDELQDGDADERATDGCRVEPDGACEHGHESWLLYLGLI